MERSLSEPENPRVLERIKYHTDKIRELKETRKNMVVKWYVF